MTARTRILQAAVAASLLSAACSAWAGSTYQLANTAFGAPVAYGPGDSISWETDQWAFGLNDRGQVISQTVGNYNNGYTITNYLSSGASVSAVSGPVLGSQAHTYGGGGPSTFFNYIGGINNSGQIADTVGDSSGFHGLIQNADGSTKVLPTGTSIGGDSLFATPQTTNGLNNRGDVAGSVRLSDGTSAPFYEAAASSTPAVISSPLGFGGIGNAVNLSGQVTGGLFLAAQTPNSRAMPGYVDAGTEPALEAFLTNANGAGVRLLGTANGVASEGFAVNDLGQVGGELVLASGQTEAFLTTRSGTIVGLGAGNVGDSTATLFVNNLGQAIIRDFTGTYDPSTDSFTPGGYYLYSGGKIVPITSLLPAGFTWGWNEAVTGLDNNGDILLGDPMLLTAPTDWSAIGGAQGAVDVLSTDVYAQVSSAQGGAGADASFLATPSSGAPTAGVPEPATFGLLGLGALLAARRSRKAPRG